MRDASSLDRLPDRNADTAACAPAGYPPKIPANKTDSDPAGIEQMLPSDCMNAVEMPEKDCVIKFVSIKNGKSDGITQLRQNAIPSCVPLMAVSPSKISIRMPTAEKNPVHRFLFFRSITSEDSMQNLF